MRFEIPATIVVEAATVVEGRRRAEEMSDAVGEASRPGTPFHDVGVVPMDAPEACDEERELESVREHVQGIREDRF
jgi:hypothetical protein